MFADKKLYEAIFTYGIRENQTIQIKRTMTDFEKNGEARKYKTYDLVPPEGEDRPTGESVLPSVKVDQEEQSRENFLKADESEDMFGGDL